MNGNTMNKKFEKYSNSGLTGLTNCGNTCYLNTCLQILSHTYEFNDILNNGDFRRYLKKTPDGVLLHEWDELRKLMWSENCIVTPKRFLRVVQSVAASKNRHLFTGYSQNDMTEFLLFVMECFHEGLSREVNMSVKGKTITQKDLLAKKCYERIIELYQKSYSELLDLFFGIQVWSSQVIINGKPEEANIDDMNPDPFMSLDLWLEAQAPSRTLDECIRKNMEPEKIEGFKDKEGNQKQRLLKFWCLPQVLMINIKRYTPFGQKIRTPVCPNEEIDMGPYMIGYTSTQSNYYELFAAAIHSGGSIQGGHYYAIIRNSNGKWYIFNDTNVIEFKGDETNLKMKLSEASCFFYRKK
jgi:ubiquitin C-terminal hydrolase